MVVHAFKKERKKSKERRNEMKQYPGSFSRFLSRNGTSRHAHIPPQKWPGLILDLPSPLGLCWATRPESSSTMSLSALAALLCSLSVPHCSGQVVSLLFPFRAFYCGFDWQFANDDWCRAPSTCSLALVNFLCISHRQTFGQLYFPLYCELLRFL